jgi:hypothetical protein
LQNPPVKIAPSKVEDFGSDF